MFEKKGMNMYELQNSQNTENTKVYWDSFCMKKIHGCHRPPGIARWFFRCFRRMGLKGFGLAARDDPTSNCTNVSEENQLIVGIEIINHFLVCKSIYNDLECDWYDLYIWLTCWNSLEILVWSGQFYMSTAAWSCVWEEYIFVGLFSNCFIVNH